MQSLLQHKLPAGPARGLRRREPACASSGPNNAEVEESNQAPPPAPAGAEPARPTYRPRLTRSVAAALRAAHSPQPADARAKTGLLARVVAAESVEAVLACLDRSSLASASPVATCAALHRLAKHAARAPPATREALLTDSRFGWLKARADAQLVFMLPRNLANILWALATLRHLPPPAWRAAFVAAALAATEGGQFEAQHVSVIVWACASLRWHPGDALLAALVACARPLLPRFSGQNVANLLHGCVRLGYSPGSPFLEALVEASAPALAAFAPLELSTAVFALAMLDHTPSDAWLANLEAAALSRPERLTAACISHMLLAHVRLRRSPSRTALETYARALASAGDVTPRSLASSMYAFAALHCVERDGASTRSQPCPSPGALAALCACMQRRLGAFSPAQCGQTLWALAQLSHDPGLSWRAAFCAASQPALPQYQPSDLAAVLHGFASLGVCPGAPWLGAWEAAAAPQWPLFEARHAANALWALAALDTRARGLALGACDVAWARLGAAAAAASPAPAILPPQGWCSVFQAALLQQAQTGASPLDQLPGECKATALAAWRSQVQAVRVSGLQREVARTLGDALGVPATLEARVGGGLASVDLAIAAEAMARLPGAPCLRTALEVDGPAHFVRCGNALRPSGATLLRNRLLAALGWRVVVVPFYAWPGEGVGRARVLSALLTERVAQAE